MRVSKPLRWGLAIAGIFLAYTLSERLAYAPHAVVEVAPGESVCVYRQRLPGAAAIRVSLRSGGVEVGVHKYFGDWFAGLTEAVIFSENGRRTVGVFVCGGPSIPVELAFFESGGQITIVPFSPSAAAALRSNIIKRYRPTPAELTDHDPLYWSCSQAHYKFREFVGSDRERPRILPALP